MKKKKTILDRYELTEENQVVIDVSIRNIEQLYHNFDKSAPYYRKELDDQFVEYLTKSVQEIGKWPFVIRFSLERMPDERLIERVRGSINSYCEYLKEVEVISIKRMIRRFAVLFAVGLVFLFFAITATRHAAATAEVVAEVFAQGLTIAAWVSLWEAFVYIFLEWHPHRERFRLYEKIINSPITFRKIK